MNWAFGFALLFRQFTETKHKAEFMVHLYQLILLRAFSEAVSV